MTGIKAEPSYLYHFLPQDLYFLVSNNNLMVTLWITLVNAHNALHTASVAKFTYYRLQ